MAGALQERGVCVCVGVGSGGFWFENGARCKGSGNGGGGVQAIPDPGVGGGEGWCWQVLVNAGMSGRVLLGNFSLLAEGEGREGEGRGVNRCTALGLLRGSGLSLP